jgi:hypothetical protein
VAEFVIGIVVNVLGHVAIQDLKSGGVCGVPPSGSWLSAGCGIRRFKKAVYPRR